MAGTIETEPTIKPYLTATIKTWPAKYETLTSYNWNRKELENSLLLTKTRPHIVEKEWPLIGFQNELMYEGVKNRAIHFDFGWLRALRLKDTVCPAPALHKQLQSKAKFA